MTRQRSPRRPAQRPDQILDAAERLLAPGAVGLTMDALAAAAGLGKGTLYHYYASKTEVLDALRRRYLARSVAAAVAVSGPGEPAPARLEAFIRALLEYAVAHGPLVWTLFHDAGIADHAPLSIVGDALRDLIRYGVDRGDLAVDDVEEVAGFFVHGFFGRVESAFHDGAIDPAALTAELVSLLERLVTPVRPARARP